MHFIYYGWGEKKGGKQLRKLEARRKINLEATCCAIRLKQQTPQTK